MSGFIKKSCYLFVILLKISIVGIQYLEISNFGTTAIPARIGNLTILHYYFT